MSWFKQQIMNDPSTSEILTWLANSLKFHVLCCSRYEVNGCLFYTKSQDDRSTMQNSGVTLEAESMQFSTSKYQNHVVGSMPYYGVILEIWEVNYIKFSVLFSNVSGLTIRLVPMLMNQERLWLTFER